MSKGEAAAGPVSERARFLARLEPFKGLSPEELERIADEIIERDVSAGEAVLVENGPPGAELYVVRSGAVELAHKEAVVAVLTSGEVFGYPTLLTGLAPEFTARVREDGRLYCIPSDVALEFLSRPDGVRFVAGNLRERLIQSASTMLALPDVRTRPVTSLVRSDPIFCEPDTPIHDAAQILMDAGRSAILVRTRGRARHRHRRRLPRQGRGRRHPQRRAGGQDHDLAGPHHRRRGPGAGGQHRDDGLGREPPAGARQRRQRGRDPVGEQPHGSRRTQPVRAAPFSLAVP